NALVPDDRCRAAVARQRRSPEKILLLPLHRIRAALRATVVLRPAPAWPIVFAKRRHRDDGVHQNEKQLWVESLHTKEWATSTPEESRGQQIGRGAKRQQHGNRRH